MRRLRRTFLAELRSTDTFLVGHAKSGNTWLAYVLAHLMRRPDGEEVNIRNLGAVVPIQHGADSYITYFRHLRNPRCFRNEWPLFPDDYPRTVYLIRDPRAVVVSLYHHHLVLSGSSDSLDRFVEGYLTAADGKIPGVDMHFIRWDLQVADWINRAQRQSVLFHRYEDMVADRRAAVLRVLDYLDLSVPADDLDAVVARSSFDAMRSDEAEHGAESFVGARAQGWFVRRGSASGWRDELSDASARRIVDAMGDVMARVGYPVAP